MTTAHSKSEKIPLARAISNIPFRVTLLQNLLQSLFSEKNFNLTLIKLMKLLDTRQIKWEHYLNLTLFNRHRALHLSAQSSSEPPIRLENDRLRGGKIRLNNLSKIFAYKQSV